MARGIVGRGVVAALLLLAPPSAAQAAKIKVTGELDELNGTTPATCSLREAISTANSDTEQEGCERVGAGTDDTIVLRGGTTYSRSLTAAPEDANASGDLDVTGPTTIVVKGEGKATIDAGGFGRVIDVLPDASLEASRLVVLGGISAGGEIIGGGGGILARGKLTLRASTLKQNLASDGCACGGGLAVFGPTKARLDRVVVKDNGVTNFGGGIAVSFGKLIVDDSTVTGNDASGSGGGIGSSGSDRIKIARSTISHNDSFPNDTMSGNSGGGGIFLSNVEEPVRILNSTISGNHTDGAGGGVRNYGSTAIAIASTTVTGNTGDDNADGAVAIPWAGGLAGSMQVRNSIVAGNHDNSTLAPKDDCDTQLDPGHNLVGVDTGCGSTGSNTEVADARLKPLAKNGGPTQTHALRPGSKAIGRAGLDSPPLDQRSRRRDAHPDAGAYER